MHRLEATLFAALLVGTSCATFAQEGKGRPHEQARVEAAKREEVARTEQRRERERASGDANARQQAREQQKQAADKAAADMRRAMEQSKASAQALQQSGTTTGKTHEATSPTVPNAKPVQNNGGAAKGKSLG